MRLCAFRYAVVAGFVYDQATGRLGARGPRRGTRSIAHRFPRAVVTTTLDNLLKGAASQCVQNINLMLGLPE